MNLILHNGQIYTMENESDIYSAIAVEDGKVVQLGGEELLKLKADQVIDLKGKIVIPGFNDSHIHLLGLGAALNQVDLVEAKSVDDVIEITKKFISENNIEEGAWVVGRGWNQDYFEDKRIPTNKDLDMISENHFIFLRRACGHVATCNSKILSTYNFTEEKTLIDGGEYENGVFKENALDLVTAKMPDPSRDDLKKWILSGEKYLNTLGITSVQSDDLCVFSEDLQVDVFSSMIELDIVQQHTLRVYEQSLFRNQKNLEKELESGYFQNKGSHNFKLGPLKILGDGSLGGRTAWLNQPYHDDPTTTGIHMYTQDELNSYVLKAHENDVASAIHCIGDKMLDSALDAIENAHSVVNKPNLRHGIVHCQITTTEQLERMKALNVMAYVQPIFLDYDAHIVYDRVGKLADTSYSWKTMKDLGVKMSFGSDAPVDSADPLKGIHCAVTRKGLNMTPEGGYLPQQALSVYDAIHYYTVEGAYASHEEDIKGKLIPDYLADMVVLKGDIFENVLNTKIDMTIVNGKIVYKRAAD